jgi:hypothetical protein
MEVNITRYEGTRLITQEEVDTEFLGGCVLVDLSSFPNQSKGYLLVSALGEERAAYKAILEIKVNEFNGKHKILSGCSKRGEMVLGLYY